MYSFTGSANNTPQDRQRGGFDRVLNTSNAVLDTFNRVMCSINPRRPNCQTVPEQVIVEQRRQTQWVMIVGLIIVMLILFLIIRKK
jgi:hypothetical protein